MKDNELHLLKQLVTAFAEKVGSESSISTDASGIVTIKIMPKDSFISAAELDKIKSKVPEVYITNWFKYHERYDLPVEVLGKTIIFPNGEIYKIMGVVDPALPSNQIAAWRIDGGARRKRHNYRIPPSAVARAWKLSQAKEETNLLQKK